MPTEFQTMAADQLMSVRNAMFGKGLAALIVISIGLFGGVRAQDQSSTSAHDFSFTAIDGTEMPLSDFKGKTVLVVNTASQCNFTKQYGPLQSLYEEYKDRGLVIIGVPSNDFGGQEPGPEAEISAFAEAEFNVGFPLAAKTKVKGKDASPFYRWAADQVGPVGKPRWNFHKYLIGPNGEMIDWFSTVTKPESAKIRKAIEQNLPDINADNES